MFYIISRIILATLELSLCMMESLSFVGELRFHVTHFILLYYVRFIQ